MGTGTTAHCIATSMVCVSCNKGPPINASFTCASCSGSVHLHCGDSKCTGPAMMCVPCHAALKGQVATAKENETPATPFGSTAFRQYQTSLQDAVKKPPSVPASQHQGCSGGRPPLKRRRGGEVVMSSPPDSILGHVGGAEISGVGGNVGSDSGGRTTTDNGNKGFSGRVFQDV